MNITLNKFEVEFLRNMLTAKQLEYKSIGLKTGTVNSILEKLKEKSIEHMKMDFDNLSDSDESELIVHAPSKGRLTKLYYEIPDKASEIRAMQNYLVEKNLEEMMEPIKHNLNIPFIKR